jgi:hypothetical protein
MTDDNSTPDDNDENDSDVSFMYPDRLLEQGRERGLSKADRRYLASGGGTVENEGTDVNTRSRIRERIRETIVDFWLIQEYLSDYDRDLLFGPSNDDWDNRELQIGLKSTMQFFYTALEHTDLADFETVLTSAVHDAKYDASNEPVLVDVDFDVEVNEQFRVEEAYDKFQRGIPLNPMEIGVLLTSGQVNEPEEIEYLARHARSNGLIEQSVPPLLAKQLADITGDTDPLDTFWFTWTHLSETEYSGITPPPRLSDYEYLEEEQRYQDAIQRSDQQPVTIDDLADDDLAQELSELHNQPGDDEQRQASDATAADASGDSADKDLSDAYEDHMTAAVGKLDSALRQVSGTLDVPITLGDEMVYEGGDRYFLDGGDGADGQKKAEKPDSNDDPASAVLEDLIEGVELDSDDDGEKGADSPADTDDDADGSEG